MIYARSLLFMLCFYSVTAVIAVGFAPLLLFSERITRWAGRWWSRSTMWLLRVICGISYEVRGQEYLTTEPVVFASKHQSAWDTMIYWILLEKPVFVLKKELTRIPFYGQILRKLGSISIDRNGKSEALKHMIAQAKQTIASGHPIIIFPEGTRMLPGAAPDYQPGVAALYSKLGVRVVPVALNAGLFWSKYGLKKPSGTILIEFLPPIEVGMRSRDFLALLEKSVEEKSNLLIAEAKATMQAGV